MAPDFLNDFLHLTCWNLLLSTENLNISILRHSRIVLYGFGVVFFTAKLDSCLLLLKTEIHKTKQKQCMLNKINIFLILGSFIAISSYPFDCICSKGQNCEIPVLSPVLLHFGTPRTCILFSINLQSITIQKKY